MIKKWICCFIFTLLACSVQAGSVRLINDSPYKLRAVVRGADGTPLGEMIVASGNNGTWNDSFSHLGQFGKGNLADEQVTRSQTPYDVLWYCVDGSDYSFCYQVATGATVNAQGCSGTRMCKPQKKESGPFPNQPEGQSLYQPPQQQQSCTPCCPNCQQTQPCPEHQTTPNSAEAAPKTP
jgi:hypothetical protein